MRGPIAVLLSACAASTDGSDDDDALVVDRESLSTGADVAWALSDQDVELSAGTAMDWAFPYTAVVPEGASYKLLVRTCEGSACSVSLLANPATSGEGTLRFGIDPSSYAPGENTFTLTLVLVGDAQRVADKLTIHAYVSR